MIKIKKIGALYQASFNTLSGEKKETEWMDKKTLLTTLVAEGNHQTDIFDAIAEADLNA